MTPEVFSIPVTIGAVALAIDKPFKVLELQLYPMTDVFVVSNTPTAIPTWPILLVVAILIPLMVVAFQRIINK